MRKLAVLILCLALGRNNVTSQTSTGSDSLINKLETTPEDTNRVKLLNQLGFNYFLNKPDSTHLLGQQAWELSQKLNYPQGEYRAMTIIALAYGQLGEYAKALKLYDQSRKGYIELKDTDRVVKTLNNMAIIFGAQNDWEKALKSFKDAYIIYNTIADPIENGGIQPVLLLNIGESYLNLKQLDSAFIYLRLALPLAKTRRPDLLNNIEYDLGDLALARNNAVEAISHYRQSIDYSVKNGAIQPLYEVYYRMAKLYQEKKQQDSTVHYAKLAIDFSQKSSYIKGVLSASTLLSELYEGTNDAAALQYYKLATAAKDSLYSQDKLQGLLSISFEEKQEEQRIEAARIAYKNKINLYALIGILAVFGLIALFLFSNNRRKQKANNLLQKQKEEIKLQSDKIEKTLDELKATQVQLIQSEKMASLGELTAGIAHEIQNPLNFVNNFSEVNKELLAEMNEEIEKGNYNEVKAIANDVTENQEKINHHGKRADAIVKSMLQHSRSRSGAKELTDINALADEYLRLSYHGLRAKDNSFNVAMKTDYDESIGNINIIPQDMGRVLLNLYNNAFYAVGEKINVPASSAGQANGYEPTISVITKKINNKVEIRVMDNGNGISQIVLDKIFQPFFTTKPTGQGTGLGLSLSYDIIKAHGGELKAASKEGQSTVFTIIIPMV